MAGHSKFKNIQHRKNAQDAKRGKLFTKFIREITKAAQLNGGDPSTNPRLRLAMDKALVANMTKDTIENAIKRGIGSNDSALMEDLSYEGYGPAGVAVLVECMTDNRNRTAGDVRHAFTKCGGNLGTDGSVAYLFAKKGQLNFAPGMDEDLIIEIALEAGAEDVVSHDDGSIEVVTTPEAFSEIKTVLIAKGLEPEQAEVTYVPATYVDLDPESAEKMLKLIDMLEDLDDVQNVYSNANISDTILEALA